MNNNTKRILVTAGTILAVAGCLALGPKESRYAFAMNNTTIKAMGTVSTSTYSTTSIAARSVTLYGVFVQPNGATPVVYLDCFNTANPTLGTTKPVVEFLATSPATASHGSPYFFAGGLPLGGSALTCAAVTLSHGSATASANVSLFWQ